MQHVARVIVWLLSSWACGAHALDAERTLAELHHEGWTAADGAPGQVTALAQTADGYLWIGTHTGLVRFDGVTFERYVPKHGVFPSDGVSALYAPTGGGLWVGFRYGGASLLAGDSVTSFVEADGFSTGSVFGFARDGDGIVWAATFQGLMRFDGTRWQWVRDEWGYVGRSARAVMVDRRGALWVASEDAMMVLPRDARRFVALPAPIGLVSRLAEAPDGIVWIVETDALRAYADARTRAVLDGPRVAMASSGLAFDRDGTLWVGTAGEGLVRHVEIGPDARAHENFASLAQHFTEQSGLTADAVGPVLEDREGNVWVGTNRGLDRFRASRFVPAPFPKGSADFALVAGAEGAVWAGTRNRPLMQLRDGEVRNAPLDVAITCAMRDRDGVLWFGGRSGIHRVVGEGAPEKFADLPSIAAGSGVQAMARDRAGALWVSLNVPGIFRYAGGEWTHFDHVPGLLERASPLTVYADDGAASDAADESGSRIWLGYSRNRMTVIDGARMTLMTAADGLAVGNVTAILRGSERLWIAGERGLATLDGARLRLIAIGEMFQGISGIVERANGELWLNGGRGVVRIPAIEWKRALADANHTVRYEHYDVLDGLPGAPAQFRPLPTAVEATDGRLWFATTSGVVSLDPSALTTNVLPPPVFVRALLVGNRVYDGSAPIALPPHTNHLALRYTANSLAIPERVRFRHRLDGVDADWQDAGARREAFYTNLGPGDYRFRVVAATDDGVWNEAGDTLAFSILPAWWQTRWFAALIALTAVALLWLAYYLRLRAVGARVRLALHARHRERERIARELHDTLLQGTQGLILRFQAAADALAPGVERDRLERALDTAERLLVESRDRVGDLRATPPFDDLPQALAAVGQELAHGAAVEFAVTVEGAPRPLDEEVREEVFRIAREALLNAFQHARAERIETELHYDASSLRVRVRDDGRGIDAAVLAEGSRPGHWGLVGMSERARRVGGALEVWSRPGQGTEVELRLPGAIAYGAEATRPWWKRAFGPR